MVFITLIPKIDAVTIIIKLATMHSMLKNYVEAIIFKIDSGTTQVQLLLKVWHLTK